MSWICKKDKDNIDVFWGSTFLGQYPLLKEPYCAICACPGVNIESCKQLHELDCFDKVYALGIYYKKRLYTGDLLSMHILDLKNDRSFAQPLGKGMAIVAKEVYPEILQSDGLVPIPLHPEEFARREFNQSLDLAKILEKETNIPVVDVLEKTRPKSLQGLTLLERRAAVDSLYKVKDSVNIQDKNLIIIDDVFASGSTSSESARMLKLANAKSAKVFVAGRGIFT